jgi:hypothetical protein
MRARDVIFGQSGAYRCPCGFELRLTVFEVEAAPVSARSGLAVDVTGPRPLREVRWHAAALHDPANRQAAPDHLIVVGVALASDHGGAEGDGFRVGQVILPVEQLILIKCMEVSQR